MNKSSFEAVEAAAAEPVDAKEPEENLDPKDVEPTVGGDPNRAVMSPRLVLCVVDKTGFPPLPARLGPVVIYDWVGIHADGLTREYRIEGTDRLVVILRGALRYLEDGTAVTLATVTIPAATIDGSNEAFDRLSAVLVRRGLIHGVWAPTLSKEGEVTWLELDEPSDEASKFAFLIREEEAKRAEESRQKTADAMAAKPEIVDPDAVAAEEKELKR